jgi:ubiquinone biosynthesis protein
MQILRVFARLKFLGALRGKRHWPLPKEVWETFEDSSCWRWLGV